MTAEASPLPTVSVEDNLAVQDVLARYCFYVDEGDGDAYADLWTDDGVFAGIAPEPVRGREALRAIPAGSLSVGARHKHVNMFVEYQGTTNDIVAVAYNLVTTWLGEPRLSSLGIAKYHLIRVGNRWKIKSKTTRMIVPEGFRGAELPAGYPLPANVATTWPSVF